MSLTFLRSRQAPHIEQVTTMQYAFQIQYVANDTKQKIIDVPLTCNAEYNWLTIRTKVGFYYVY